MDFTNNNWAGVDEAGRGPLAGPVVAAAVILPVNHTITGLNDSKLLSPAARERLYHEIKKTGIWSIGRAEVEEIDELNILQATLLAMQRAVGGLPHIPEGIWVDGLHAPKVSCPVQTIIEGDKKVPAISAASILAKVTRDAWMCEYHLAYPQYGFAQHKGYGTKEHQKALRTFGPCPLHRQSFAPVRDLQPADT